MSYGRRTARNGSDKQKLYDYVNWSAKHLMEDEDDVAEYFEHFQALSKPVLYCYGISGRECNELFWQGFHPDDHAILYPHIVNSCPFWKPGPDFDFRKLFDKVHDIFYQWSLEDKAAEAEAARRRKLAQEEEDQKLECLI